MLYAPSSMPSAGELRRMAGERIVHELAGYCRAAFAANGGLPVVVPARDEEKDLPATLAQLAKTRRQINPIVVANNCRDRTAEFAGAMGARVIEEPRPGKMEAIKTALRKLCENNERTILFTDADTLVSPQWARHMSRLARTAADTGGIVVGAAVFMDGGRADMDALHTIWTGLQNSIRAVRRRDMIASGFNLGIQLDPQGRILEEILQFPNYFPGEDATMKHAVQRLGGRVVNATHPGTLVRTRGDRYNSSLVPTAIRAIAKKAGWGPTLTGDYSEYRGDFVPYAIRN